MKKYLVAFASVLAFSAPAMASEQAIEFMSDAQLGQHSGAKLVVVVPTEEYGILTYEFKPHVVFDWIASSGKGNVTINGETFTTIDSLGKPIESRINELKTKLMLMSKSNRNHVVKKDKDQVTIVSNDVLTPPTFTIPNQPGPRPVKNFLQSVGRR